MYNEHKPVLERETIEALVTKPNGTYIDATFGRGGHSQAILEQLGPDGQLLAIDKDLAAVEFANSLPLAADPRFHIEHVSFENLKDTVTRFNKMQEIDGVLLDLGVSSPQLDDPQRGFSFLREGPLDMRMNRQQPYCAADWIRDTKEDEMRYVFRRYGEEKYARRIAQAINCVRENEPIATTLQLAEIIERAVPARERYKHKHPATKCFQAIRLVINHELEALTAALKQCLEVMSVGGRICAISFHSLEDRIVKRFFQQAARGKYPSQLPIPDAQLQRELGIVIKRLRPNEQEIAANRRARSAILRVAEKLL